MRPAPPSLADLVFVSFNGRVFAVHRDTGQLVWRWVAGRGSRSVVTILPDGDRLYASCQGYTWALDALSGRELWYQPFSGEGYGIPMIATARHSSMSPSAAAAIAAQQAAAAGAAAAAAAASAAAASS